MKLSLIPLLKAAWRSLEATYLTEHSVAKVVLTPTSRGLNDCGQLQAGWIGGDRLEALCYRMAL